MPVSDVQLGDVVFMREYEHGWKTYPVIGFGGGKRNGFDLNGVTYVEHYDHDGDYSWNINVRDETAYILPRK